MKYTMIAYSSSTDVIGSIHRTGCQDIMKDANNHGGSITNLDVASLKEALAFYIDEGMIEMGYSNADVKVLPCAK